MTAEEILAALASDWFIALKNHGTHWSIEYKNIDGGSAFVTSKKLDSLIKTWVALVEEFDAQA